MTTAATTEPAAETISPNSMIVSNTSPEGFNKIKAAQTIKKTINVINAKYPNIEIEEGLLLIGLFTNTGYIISC
jgi:hypothetical protein